MIIPPLTKSYDGRRVLSTPELELQTGCIYAVIGANGSGKSTLAKLISGVQRSDNGAVLRGASVGYMPQKSYAFRMSVQANIMLGGSDREKCEALMRMLHMEVLADKPGHKLSGGETARMALCRLLMRCYDLVILDEPTAAMDMESTLLSEELLREYCRCSGCAMLLVTHSLQQAKRMADEVLFFQEGELVEKGDRDEIFQNAADGRTRRFLKFYGV